MTMIKKTYSKNNNEITLIQEGLNSGAKTILIVGVVHGDEPQGKFLIENYLKSLRGGKCYHRNNPKNRVLFIPCLNPDGLALGTRENANGVDINRNFPTPNSENTNLSEFHVPEIETRFLMEIVDEFFPDIILTLHAPYKVVNYDGPAQDIAEAISKIIGYPTSNDIGYPTPGSFGTYAGIERNIPIITLELDEEIDVKELISPVNQIFDYLANV